MLKRMLFIWMALLVGIGLPLLVLEGSMRVFGWGKPLRNHAGYDRSKFYYRPAGARQHPWSKGAPSVLKVAVIGDSISNGAGVQKDDSYGFRLERLLNMNDGMRPAEVFVYAKGGTSTYMQLDFLKNALQQQPELVILGICLNDTEDWTRPQQLKQWREERLPRVPGPALARAMKSSRALTWIYNRVQSFRCNRAFLPSYERLFDPEYSGWKKFVLAIREFQRQCGERHIPFIAVIFPELSQVKDYPLDFVHDRIHEALANEQVRYLDLLNDYRGRDPFRLQVIPFVDSHPNEIAHRLAAESIFEYLLANELIDPGYLPTNRSGRHVDFWKRVAGRLQDPLGQAGATNQAAPDTDF